MTIEEITVEESREESAVLVEYKCDHLESMRWFIISRQIPAEIDHPPKVICVECLKLIQEGIVAKPTYRIKKAFMLDEV